MAYIYEEPSHTFGEYLLIPVIPLLSARLQTSACVHPASNSARARKNAAFDEYSAGLRDHAGRFREKSSQLRWPRRAVSPSSMVLSRIETKAAMVARVKAYKAGYVTSDSNVRPDATLQDILDLKAVTGHDTIAVTEDGTATGRLLGIVTGRDYRSPVWHAPSVLPTYDSL